MPGADGFKMSNPPAFSLIGMIASFEVNLTIFQNLAHLPYSSFDPLFVSLPLFLISLSLQIFKEVSMAQLTLKSRILTGYLELLIEEYFSSKNCYESLVT